MKLRYEVLGNEKPYLCRVIGEYFTLGAARKAADKAYEDPKNVLRFYSIDVDDGRGKVFYTVVRPEAALAKLLAFDAFEELTGDERIET